MAVGDMTGRRWARAMQRLLKRPARWRPTDVPNPRRLSMAENRAIWDSYDWSRGGDEWTEAVRSLRGIDPDEWKRAIEREMWRHLPRDGAILEIGPGSGRWSALLQAHARRLVLADISPRCLELCQERFATCANVEYEQVTDGTLDFLSASSMDGVWSYDVFVHICAEDTDRYLSELNRVLRPGATAVIHHAGTYPTDAAAASGFRSEVDASRFAEMATVRGLVVGSQDTDLAHKPGDVITVLRRPPENGRSSG